MKQIWEGNIILYSGIAELLGFNPIDFGSKDDGSHNAKHNLYIPDPNVCCIRI